MQEQPKKKNKQAPDPLHSLIVVGGGAAGLMAAIQAAQQGVSVTILEHNEKTGRKICVTGNGRCNLTNLNQYKEAYRGTNPDFASGVFRQFSVTDTLDFFEKIGILTVEKKGWLYPRSGQAKSVSELLEAKARSLKVKIKTREHVTKVFQKDGLWNVRTEGWTYQGAAVILANGSKASSVSGSDGSGYEIATALGHQIIPPLPALLGLKCRDRGFSSWSGVRTEGRLTLLIDGVPQKEEEGELQLTEYGISGIPVFQLSRYAVRALSEKKKAALRINFFPEYTEEELRALLENRKKLCPYQTEPELLTGLLPDKLIKVLMKQKDPLGSACGFELEITGNTGFEQAQVCSGGVDTSQVDPMTLESRLHKGLFFAGELLDIDGACGGYNLQWAWSSGAAAGIHGAKEII